MNAKMNFTTDKDTGALKVRIEGTFDGPAALQLQQLLEDLKANTVDLDFSQTRQFLDVAVGLVTRAIANRQVRLFGLGEHQARMFKYFGVKTPGSTERPAYYKPEDVLATH